MPTTLAEKLQAAISDPNEFARLAAQAIDGEDSGMRTLPMVGVLWGGVEPEPIILSAQYRWVRTGKRVDIHFFIKLDEDNIGFNFLVFNLPPGVPVPMVWDGLEFDDSIMQGSGQSGDYSDNGYGTAGTMGFQIAKSPAAPSGFDLYMFDPQGIATGKKNRVWGSISYLIP